MAHFIMIDQGPPGVSYIGTRSIFTGSPGSVSFGIPALGGNQWTVVAMSFLGSSRSISSIGGASPTKLVESANTGGSIDTRTSLWIAKPSAGLTTITIPTATGAEAYSLYLVSNLINGGAASDTSATSSNILPALSAPSRSIVISVALLQAAGAPATAITWTGGVIEDAFSGGTLGITDLRWSTAHANPTNATTYNISFVFNGGGFTTGSAVSLR